MTRHECCFLSRLWQDPDLFWASQPSLGLSCPALCSASGQESLFVSSPIQNTSLAYSASGLENSFVSSPTLISCNLRQSPTILRITLGKFAEKSRSLPKVQRAALMYQPKNNVIKYRTTITPVRFGQVTGTCSMFISCSCRMVCLLPSALPSSLM